MKPSMQTSRAQFVAAFALLTGLLALGGCAKRPSAPQRQMREEDGMVVSLTARPGLPQDTGSATSGSGAQTGDNTLIVTLVDNRTGAPIPDANVSAYASTQLTGQQRAESGRAQGNGLYLIPIRFGVPDTYKVIVDVQRPGRKFPTTLQFDVTAT